jgi:hypothetical protein
MVDKYALPLYTKKVFIHLLLMNFFIYTSNIILFVFLINNSFGFVHG